MTRPVKKGEELLIAYGKNYWESKKELQQAAGTVDKPIVIHGLQCMNRLLVQQGAGSTGSVTDSTVLRNSLDTIIAAKQHLAAASVCIDSSDSIASGIRRVNETVLLERS